MHHKEIHKSIKQGEMDFFSGDMERAKSCFQAILAAKPDQLEAINNLGVVYFEQGQLERAIGYFHKALAIDNDNLDATASLAKCLSRKGDFLEAANLWRKVVALGGADAETLKSMACCLIELGDLLSGKKILEQLLEPESCRNFPAGIIRPLSMKVFIDAGAHDGCSVTRFRGLFDPKNEYHIYSFEVDPDFTHCFTNIPNHTFINKAIWIEDGHQKFYRSNSLLQDGGTLIKNKRTGDIDKERPIIVETIDLSSWILNTFSPSDYIILKMDIEGSEYEVISKMIEDSAFAYINELWIEWHYYKINLSENKHTELLNKISIPIRNWCALNWCELKKKALLPISCRKPGKF